MLPAKNLEILYTVHRSALLDDIENLVKTTVQRNSHGLIGKIIAKAFLALLAHNPQIVRHEFDIHMNEWVENLMPYGLAPSASVSDNIKINEKPFFEKMMQIADHIALSHPSAWIKKLYKTFKPEAQSYFRSAIDDLSLIFEKYYLLLPAH